MRVCMVVFGDLPYDFRVYREAAALREAGHSLSLVASDFGSRPLPDVWNDFEIRWVEIDRAASLRRSYPAFWQQATALARQAQAQVYHAHDLDSLWPAARAAATHGARLVYDSHELFCEQSSLVGRPAVAGFWRLLERWLIRRVDRVLTVSPTIAQRLQARYRLPTPVAVVRNLPPYREPLPGGRLRQMLGLVGDTEPLALYQGGFLTDNGLSEQIDAMRQIAVGRLVLLGSGPTESVLRQQVAASGLQDRVRFLARVPFPELHELTCGADVGLCVIKPTGRSFLWSMPNKLFEYLMAGLPVVAGDTPEIRRVIEDTGAGVLVDPTDPGALGAVLEPLLADAERRQALRHAALEGARRYCWEQEAGRLLEIYESL